MDWSQLTNGELLAAATDAGFEVLVTTDQNLRYQQDLKERTIVVVVLMTTSWPRIEKRSGKVAEAINECGRGSYAEIEV
jgi:hypothetical protein